MSIFTNWLNKNHKNQENDKPIIKKEKDNFAQKILIGSSGTGKTRHIIIPTTEPDRTEKEENEPITKNSTDSLIESKTPKDGKISRERYFMTMQPIAVAKALEEGDYKAEEGKYTEIESETGYAPIFLIPLDSKPDLLIRMFFSTPGKMDCIVIFKADTYHCLDAAEWYRVKGGKEKEKPIVIEEDIPGKEKEYITDVIKKANVADVIFPIEDYTTNGCINGINYARLDERQRQQLILYSNKFWRDMKKYLLDPSGTGMTSFIESKEFCEIMNKTQVSLMNSITRHTEDVMMEKYMKTFRQDVEFVYMKHNK